MLVQAGEGGLCASFTARREGLDSSISLRMGCRSSVADTTGKSNTKRQPNSTIARKLRGCQKFFDDPDWRRQIKTAGSTNVNQRRLRNSSISR
jgi:hypothetical protein